MIDLEYSNSDAAQMVSDLEAKGMDNVSCSIELHHDGGCEVRVHYIDLMGERQYKNFSRMAYHSDGRESAVSQACRWIYELPDREEGLAAMKRAKILEAVETLESLGVDSDSVNAIRVIADKLASNALTYRPD